MQQELIYLAEIATVVLPLGSIQAFQGSLIAPLPFFSLTRKPHPQKTATDPFSLGSSRKQ
jgi:hypothetical protein